MSETLENAVTVIDGRPVTTSLKIAAIFGKEHKNVIGAIRRLEIPAELSQLNFKLSSYEQVQPNGGTKSCPMYEITRDGFTLLAMGFTGKKAMQFKVAYIQAFNAMESALKQNQPRTRIIPDEDVNALLNIADKQLELLNALNRATYRMQRLFAVANICTHWNIPGSWIDISDFCRAENLKFVNPKRFFNYYEARNWTIDGVKITDWHSVCRSWDLNGEEYSRIAEN